jgi:uncharacterized oligopeptide transporter (OPT) family protein
VQDYIDIYVDHRREMLKIDRRALWFNSSWVLFCIALLIYYAYQGVNFSSKVSMVCAGMMIMNAVWSLAALLISILDFIESKFRLSILNKRKDEKEIQDTIKLYNDAINAYKDMVALLEKNKQPIIVDSIPESAHGTL